MGVNNIKKDKALKPMNLSRRSFLQKTTRGAGLLGGISLLGSFSFFGCKPTALLAANPEDMKSEHYPFKLGVASGDPLPDGIVLWTKLTTNPLVVGGGDGAGKNKC